MPIVFLRLLCASIFNIHLMKLYNEELLFICRSMGLKFTQNASYAMCVRARSRKFDAKRKCIVLNSVMLRTQFVHKYIFLHFFFFGLVWFCLLISLIFWKVFVHMVVRTWCKPLCGRKHYFVSTFTLKWCRIRNSSYYCYYFFLFV